MPPPSLFFFVVFLNIVYFQRKWIRQGPVFVQHHILAVSSYNKDSKLEMISATFVVASSMQWKLSVNNKFHLKNSCPFGNSLVRNKANKIMRLKCNSPNGHAWSSFTCPWTEWLVLGKWTSSNIILVLFLSESSFCIRRRITSSGWSFLAQLLRTALRLAVVVFCACQTSSPSGGWACMGKMRLLAR